MITVIRSFLPHTKQKVGQKICNFPFFAYLQCKTYFDVINQLTFALLVLQNILHYVFDHPFQQSYLQRAFVKVKFFYTTLYQGALNKGWRNEPYAWRFYVQVQVRDAVKIQNGGAAEERKTNLRILSFKHIEGL